MNRSIIACLLLAAPLGAQQKHTITINDFEAVRNVSDPQISPDGQRILYALRTTDLNANRRTTRTFIVSSAGGPTRCWPDDTTRATEARWSPDGSKVAYVAGGQLWVANADGSGRVQVTRLTGGATGPKWAPNGEWIAFVSGVYPACRTERCNADSAQARDTSKVKAHVADQLMYRHWMSWDEGQRSHLFVVRANGEGLKDLTEGARYDVPPGPFGGSEGYAWSPDSRELAYSAKDQGRAEAWTTDVNLYTVSASGGAASVLTSSNKGADQNPVYSPDGRWIAYASQARGGFESDRWRLMLYDRQAKRSHEALPRWDRNADVFDFLDANTLIVQTIDAAREKFYRVRLGANAVASGTPELLTTRANNAAFSISKDGRMVAWLQDAAERPAEVYAGSLGSSGPIAEKKVTGENDVLVGSLDVNPVQDFWYRGGGGDSVQAFLLKPPGFTPGKKYPVILLVHGGPQGAWLDQWHGRWNYQMFAASAGGSALIIVNPRGSFGYGQEFVDQISKDWGGKVYTDLMNGVNTALSRFSYLDSTRMGAAGGSYGGYMVNWIAGHSKRFKALVSHAGPYNLENMYGATEELWFPEWEYGGAFWDPKNMTEQYRRFSPHLYAKNFRTPTLVLHGELDYRVPYTEGLSMFTALQRQNVPSRLVVFPDEGHWIGKPLNQKLWWGEVQGWLTKYLSNGAM